MLNDLKRKVFVEMIARKSGLKTPPIRAKKFNQFDSLGFMLVGVDSLGITKRYFLVVQIGGWQLLLVGVDSLGITKRYFLAVNIGD